jgi:CheY-like chemotaxis protein
MQLLQTPVPFKAVDESAKRPLVLVIEDQPTIRNMLFWTLHLQGYQGIFATHGQEALEQLELSLLNGQCPTAIVLDLIMPVMSGVKFLTHLRASWCASFPIPPIILLTVDKNNHDDLACDHVFLKPFHIKDFCESLRQATDKSYSKASQYL